MPPHPAALPSAEDHKARILVLSLDFDGCIFNAKYVKSSSPDRLMEANELVLKNITDEINKGHYDQVVFLVGSNRQSKSIDDANRGTKGSCYPAILKIAAEIQKRTGVLTEVDRFLLADIYGKRPLGENFSKAVNNEDYNFSSFIWDEFKYSLLYTQLHKIASEKPNAHITFRFYDDRKDILFCLADCYQRNKDFVPHNTKLSLFRYNGKVLKKFKAESIAAPYQHKIKGEGIIDDHYADNLSVLARCCGLDPDLGVSYSSYGNISERFYNEQIKQFKNKRLLSVKNICAELQYEIKNLSKLNYSPVDIKALMGLLQELLGAITADIIGKEKQQIANEIILNSRTIKTAYETLFMLRRFREDNIKFNEYINDERKNEIINYIDHHGVPFNYLKSSFKSLSHNVFHLFSAQTLISKKAFAVAEKLKPFLVADELAFNQLPLKREHYEFLAPPLR